MSRSLEHFKNEPIDLRYHLPSQRFIDEMKRCDSGIEVCNQPGILIDNQYFKQNIEGSLPKIYLRSFLLTRLQETLKILQPEYGFVIFDGYRSKETQKGLFENYQNQIKAKYPDWTADQIYVETRKFVAHPDEPSRFKVPPHNSGGAVDLGLTYEGHPVDMGTAFDDLTERAATDFFESPFDAHSTYSPERWQNVRTNRRILFHSLRSVGFTNWKYEWWHFDIGNCVWSQELGVSWIYGSMTPPYM